MTYSLVLDLQGADKIENSLGNLKSAIKGISSSGGQSGGIFSSGSNSPTSLMISDLAKGKVYSKDIATNLAQGFAPWRKSAVEIFKNMNPKLRDQVLANNPELAAQWKAMTNPAGIIKGLREPGGRDLAKVFGMGQLNASGKTIKGLRDITGSDLSKVAAMGVLGASTIKGLRDVGGADLAKIHAMGSFEENTKSSSFLARVAGLPMIAKYLTIVGTTVLALDILKKTITSVAYTIKDAISQAFSIYSGAIQQGLGTQFFAKRSIIASTLGVNGDPNQVYRFGAQYAEISRRLAGSIDIIGRNAPALAATAINFKILKVDFQALASEIATDAAPAINIFLAGMDMLVKGLQKYANDIAKIGVIIGVLEIGIGPTMDIIKAALSNGLPEWLKSANTSAGFMKQLPASALEKMGLVVGGGTRNNVPNLIRQTNHLLNKIVSNTTPGNLQFKGPIFFGLSPQVANP